MKADNERMQRTIARNGLQDESTELTEHSPDGGTSATSSLQKKLSLGDPTTFGLFLHILRDKNKQGNGGSGVCEDGFGA